MSALIACSCSVSPVTSASRALRVCIGTGTKLGTKMASSFPGNDETNGRKVFKESDSLILTQQVPRNH